jgi:sulfite reductase (NADPH) flavoprotein alpha-component
MLMLSVSGALLLARRLGGWRNLLRPFVATSVSAGMPKSGVCRALGLMLSALSGRFCAPPPSN